MGVIGALVSKKPPSGVFAEDTCSSLFVGLLGRLPMLSFSLLSQGRRKFLIGFILTKVGYKFFSRVLKKKREKNFFPPYF
jgi:hypothetical protein